MTSLERIREYCEYKHPHQLNPVHIIDDTRKLLLVAEAAKKLAKSSWIRKDNSGMIFESAVGHLELSKLLKTLEELEEEDGE